MELLLQRRPSDAYRTHGDLYIKKPADGIGDRMWECFTLEDPVRLDDPDTPEDEGAKVPKRTAISAGRYRVTLENSPRFGPDTVTIHDVPGFTGIRVHGGNDEGDTEGCPLVGRKRDLDATSSPFIRDCAPALNALKIKISRALSIEQVWMEIRNAE